MHVPAHYITHIGKLLETLGVDPVYWLKDNDVSHNLLQDDSLYLPVSQYEKLVESAVFLSPHPDIGLRLGEKLGLGSHGLLGYGLLLCEDLSQAAQLLDKYVSTRTAFIRTRIEEQADSLDIHINSTFKHPAVHRSFCETVVVSLANLFTVLSGQTRMEDVITEICFDYIAPEYQKLYRQYLPVPLSFSADTCKISLEKQWLHHHFSQADEVALRQLTRQFEQQIKQQRREVSDTWTQKVETIFQHEQQRFPTLQEVATLLFTTPRTLHRRLLSEGSSFRELMMKNKRAQAEKYLLTSDMSVQQIAWALGYDDVANFRRAFKSWFNMTPNEFRQQKSAKEVRHDFN